MTIVFLILAVAAAGAAALVGWPLWRSYQDRQERDLNAERYLAWRGKASRQPRPAFSLSTSERRQLSIAAVLAIAAVAFVILFLSVR